MGEVEVEVGEGRDRASEGTQGKCQWKKSWVWQGGGSWDAKGEDSEGFPI